MHPPNGPSDPAQGHREPICIPSGVRRDGHRLHGHISQQALDGVRACEHDHHAPRGPYPGDSDKSDYLLVCCVCYVFHDLVGLDGGGELHAGGLRGYRVRGILGVDLLRNLRFLTDVAHAMVGQGEGEDRDQGGRLQDPRGGLLCGERPQDGQWERRGPHAGLWLCAHRCKRRRRTRRLRLFGSKAHALVPERLVGLCRRALESRVHACAARSGCLC
mmetsp:Transcript_6177/g.19786  ORF Transcript_6177/g.19786 Transcript_6177/m.19786 type:complete len:217 (-) Transcript_6177:637-1287(-)